MWKNRKSLSPRILHRCSTAASLLILVCFVSLLTSSTCDARSAPEFDYTDPMKRYVVQERNALDFTDSPSSQPTMDPSIEPSPTPSFQPSRGPSSFPSSQPSSQPTLFPSDHPTQSPSRSMRPSVPPSSMPSILPSGLPSIVPSPMPSILPSALPTSSPTALPTAAPTASPTQLPTSLPTSLPTPLPTPLPTKSPTQSPTQPPSLSPSLMPSIQPSHFLSVLPSMQPSPQASNRPSNGHSNSPTDEYPIDIPEVGTSASYFNYNPYDTSFGPGIGSNRMHFELDVDSNDMEGSDDAHRSISEDETSSAKLVGMNYTHYEGNAWTKVNESPEFKYWDSFDGLDRNLRNKCDSKPNRKQSPIDLCEDIVNAKCFEHHQIRSRGGEFDLNNTQLQMQILPSKLRINYLIDASNTAYMNTNDEDVNSTRIPKPPRGDFAHNWNGYIPVVHIDIKIPSEHTICGKHYLGEYQIYFYHAKRRQPIVQSILMEIHPKDRKHKHFQKALNKWQDIADQRRMKCFKMERKRKLDEERFMTRMDDYFKNRMDEDKISFLDDDPLLRNSVNASQSNLYVRAYIEPTNTIIDESQARHVFFNKTVNEQKDGAPTPTFGHSHGGIHRGEAKIDSANFTSQVPLKQSGIDTARMTQVLRSTSKLKGDHPISRSNYAIDKASKTVPATASPSLKPPPPIRSNWNPFHPRIVNSIYFYGYSGSLTEPPCSEWVHWRVLDKPMQISSSQYNQMKSILFGQYDEGCRRSSVHWRGSVARPTQSLNNRPLWKCNRDDYVSDAERDRTDG